MSLTPKLISLFGAACLLGFANVTPAEARVKPCCYNYGRYYEASPSTCYRYGGRVVPQQYCYRGGYYDNGYDDGYYDDGYNDGPYNDRSYRRRPRISFEIAIGDIVIAYDDGYYDRYRRWHRWRSDRERAWYRRNHSDRWRSGRHRGDDGDWRDRDRRW